MADRQQDPGVGKEAADRRQPQQVERILVDQPLARRQTHLAPGEGPVVLAHLGQLRPGEPGEAGRIVDAEGHDPVDGLLQVGLLIHGHEGRMGIEHLFQQGGAGAGKGHDEHRAVLGRGRVGFVPAGDVGAVAAVPGDQQWRFPQAGGIRVGPGQVQQLGLVGVLQADMGLLVPPPGIQRLGQGKQVEMPAVALRAARRQFGELPARARVLALTQSRSAPRVA